MLLPCLQLINRCTSSSFFGQNSVKVLTQVRNSTKRAAGSKTSMKDSAGRRLGPKHYEGHYVKVGEIIYRQRGTVFYPGENVGIGKDHTIYAKEPGYVRYYFDPFHPRRKFIGVSLKKDVKLPLAHFSPRLRRFGHKLITNKKAKEDEEKWLPRKKELVKNSIRQELLDREVKRNEMKGNFKDFLIKNDISIKDFKIGLEYLNRLRTCLKSGYGLSDAQFNSFYYLESLITLNSKMLKWDEDKLTTELYGLQSIVDTLNSSVSFSNKFNLTKFISESDKIKMRDELITKLKDITKETHGIITNKEHVLQIRTLFENASEFLTLSEEVLLRRKFLKPIQREIGSDTFAETKTGKPITQRRFNYEQGTVDVIKRNKLAFINKLVSA